MRIILKPILFVLIGLLIFIGILPLFNASNAYSEHAEMMIKGYYELPENTADVVFIGNSHVYRFWQNAFAFKEKGVAATSWSTSNMPFGTARSVLEEVLKTQHPKVVCVEIFMFAHNSTDSNNKIYLILPYMKCSKNKYQMIEDYSNYLSIDKEDRFPYYLPFIQFHSRCFELNKGDFIQTQESYLNSCYQDNWLNSKADGLVHTSTDEVLEVPVECEVAFRDFLAYCRSLDTEVLFVAAPDWNGGEKLAHGNYLLNIVEEYGFSLINYNEEALYQTIGIDESIDLQDSSHFNVNGSLKFTRAMSDYLIAKYHLSDKRNDSHYLFYNRCADDYYELIGEYLSPVEIN